jgi:hypothetical protein
VDHEPVGADPRVGPLDFSAFLRHRRAGRDAGPYDIKCTADIGWIADLTENVFVFRTTITAPRAPIS